MRYGIFTFSIILIFIWTPVSARPKNISMECKDSTSDAAALKKAPSNVKRMLKGRVLTVTLNVDSKKENLVYKDSEKKDGELSGLRWLYCGYNSAMKLHLIKKEEEGYFSGILIDENTGEDFEAGYRIIVSHGGEHIFAARQPNGMDGEEWLLLNRYGKILWKGESFFTDKKKSIIAELESPDFDKEGNLNAVQKCTSDAPKKKTGRIILKKKDSKFEWASKIKC